MSIKKLQNDYTTPEQSKRLLELGVPADSANYCYECELIGGDKFYSLVILEDTTFSEYKHFWETPHTDIIPAWSVGRLIEIICNCHVITNQLMENWICCDKNTNLIELLIRDIEGYTIVRHMYFSKLEE